MGTPLDDVIIAGLLGKSFIPPRGATALADLHGRWLQDPRLSHVEELVLGCQSLGPVDVDGILAWPGRSRLRVLDLGDNELGIDAVVKLVTDAPFPVLTSLRLGGVLRNAAPKNKHHLVLEAVCRSAQFPALEVLELSVFEGCSKYAKDIFAGALLPSLRELSVRASDFKGNHLEGMTSWDGLASLKVLRSLSCAVTGKKLAAFLKATGPLSLEVLELAHDSLKDCPAAIAKYAEKLPHLCELTLENGDIDVASMKALADADLPSLRTLSLAENRMVNQPESLTALASAPFFKSLKVLNLCGVFPLPENLALFLERADLSNLEALRISPQGLRPERMALLRAHPRLKGEVLQMQKAGGADVTWVPAV